MKYDEGDLATYYFVINDNGVDRIIQGWTDNKDLANSYMEFHKCKNYKLKTVTKNIEEISEILEDNKHDEIQIKNIVIRHPKHPSKMKYVPAPITETEWRFINEECKTLLSSMVNYAFLNSAIPYLKGKYKEDLERILLIDAIRVTIHGKRSPILESVQLDQMMVLLYSFKDNFG